MTDTEAAETEPAIALPPIPTLDLLPARNEYTIEAVRIPMRDGVELLADHYIPQTDTPRGTLLVRSPYGRGEPYVSLWARPFAARGYHVIFQSVRGTYGSDGEFEPMVNEAADGVDTITWLRQNDWYDRRLALLGSSYSGYAIYGMTQEPVEDIKAIVISMSPQHFGGAFLQTGPFTLDMSLGWSDAIGSQVAGLADDRMLAHILAAPKRLAPVFSGLPEADAARAALGNTAPWFTDWLSHYDLDDPYWKPFDYSDGVKTTAPILLYGGWQDIFLRSTNQQWEQLQEANADNRLTLGEWFHTAPSNNAAQLIVSAALNWFDHHLAGDPLENGARVRVQIAGTEDWLDLEQWPPAASDAKLSLTESGALVAASDGGTGTATISYDPLDPTPSVGGSSLIGGGRLDNSELEARQDVATFTSRALQQPQLVAGIPSISLRLAVDNPHADVFVRLCDVDENGVSRNVTDGITRLDASVPAGESQQVRIDFAPITYRFEPGHALRLQISGGAHPTYARNLGVAEPQALSSDTKPSTRYVDLASTELTLPILTEA